MNESMIQMETAQIFMSKISVWVIEKDFQLKGK